MDLKFFKSENRLELYKENGHIPDIELTKYTFDEIDLKAKNLKTKNYSDTKIRILYSKHIPLDSNYAVLNCANSDKPKCWI